jgi:TatD DNase family protein
MKINVHTHKISGLEGVLEIVNQYPSEFDPSVPYFSIGIHPWRINLDALEEELNIIEEKIQLSNCLALGECGIDKRIDTPMSVQMEVFEKQVALAKKYEKAIILHCVGAYQEVIDCKKRLKIDTPHVIHGFSKNQQVAKSLLANGFFLSFGKYLLRNPELAAVFEAVPNDRFLLETDMIEETIFDVYEKAKSIKNMDVEAFVETNFKKVFKNNFTL